MSEIQLTEAEQKMIQLKREEEANKKKQEELQEQLKYDKYLREQDEWIEKHQKVTLHNNKLKRYAHSSLIEGGVPEDVVWLEEGKKTIKYEMSYLIDRLKKEDLKQVEVDYISLHTKYGVIYEVNPNLTAKCPTGIDSQYRDYKMNTIARKIIGKIEEEKRELIVKNKLQQTKKDLIKYFEESSPKGTKIEYSTKYKHMSSRLGGGYDINILNILYPNKSWVNIRFYADGSWKIVEKFDSKYIKPETKEEWLKYLQK